MTKLVKIGSRFVNLFNVTYVIDREIHFNDGSRWVATEPEIQDLLAIMFETPREEVIYGDPALGEDVTLPKPVVAKKTTKKK
jgi:hypothetical protein